MQKNLTTKTIVIVVTILICIFGIIGLILGNIPTTGTHLHYLVMGPATSMGLPVAAIRLAKPVSWGAKWFYGGPMGSD